MDLFIDEEYIKVSTPVTLNVAPKNLYPHAKDAQDMQLTEILGTEFLSDLLEKYIDGSLSPEETTLVEDYIKPALVFRALHLALPFINLNINNKGVMGYTDDNGVRPDNSQYNSLKKTVDDRATFRENLLIKYLAANCDTFNLYKTQTSLTTPEYIKKSTTSFLFY